MFFGMYQKQKLEQNFCFLVHYNNSQLLKIKPKPNSQQTGILNGRTPFVPNITKIKPPINPTTNPPMKY